MDATNSDVADDGNEGLNNLQLAQASFREAIRRLSEAVQRDPDAQQAIEAHYHIAESHRHAAKLPRKQLPLETIDRRRRQKLISEIKRELVAAEAGYADLLDRLNRVHEKGEMTDIEKRILRNCYFARADALYDLARHNLASYDQAIEAYLTATNRYQHEPESLEAFVQIANCHRRNNRYAEARGMLANAKVVLSHIRPEADFTQTTRYDRKQWTELLDWLAAL
jgi:tetratricopeptide (TPR) repeat protein